MFTIKVYFTGVFLPVLLLLLLCGCFAAAGEEMQDPSSQGAQIPAAPSEGEKTEQIPAYSLEALGYCIDIEMPAEVEGVTGLNYQLVVVEGNEKIRWGIYADRLSGGYTAITVTPSAMEDVAVLYLQGFYNEELEQDGAKILVAEQWYSTAEMEPYRVYRDDSITVYSMAALVNETSFEQQLMEYIQGERETPANSTWLLLEPYFNENISALIKPVGMTGIASSAP